MIDGTVIGVDCRKVYLVYRSNCGQWEDYYSWVDSAWPSMELAVAHIEAQLGMEREGADDPRLRCRWTRHDVTYYTEDDFDLDDREELLDWQEYQEDPYPAWDDMSDAWVEELAVWGGLDEWQADFDEKHGKGKKDGED